MGVRDLGFWTREAEIWREARKLDAFEVALLPRLEPDAIKDQVQKVEWHIYELENADEIDFLDKRAQAKREHDAKMKARK